MTKSLRGITFTLIPTPNKKIAEDFGLEWRGYVPPFATIIVDKEGRIRFKSVDTDYKRTSVSRIIKELQGIQ